MFWESKKEKEKRETKALEEILKAFESDKPAIQAKFKPENINTLHPVSMQQHRNSFSHRIPSVTLLAEFLASKKIIDITEWEEFKKKPDSSTSQ